MASHPRSEHYINSIAFNYSGISTQSPINSFITHSCPVFVCQECCRRFPVHIPGLESLVKTEKFQLNSTTHLDQIKICATLSADNICYAVCALITVHYLLFHPLSKNDCLLGFNLIVILCILILFIIFSHFIIIYDYILLFVQILDNSWQL